MKIFLTAMLLLLSSVLLAADEIYNSNILGMRLGQISTPEEADADYYIRISEKNGIIREYLFEQDRLFFTRSITTDDGVTTTLTEKTGELEIEKRRGGVIISEEVKRDAQPAERSDFSYNAGRLESSIFFIDDQPVYSESYLYAKDGRLLDVGRDYEDGRGSRASFSYSNGRLSRYGFTAGDQNIYIKFDTHGIVFSDTYGDGSQNETREYGVLDNGQRFELIKNTASGESRQLLFNGDERIISNIVRNIDGNLIEESSWRYRGDLISELRTRTLESLEVFSFEYREDGGLLREVYRKNGNVVQVTEYKSEYEYTEILYRFGEAVLKIKYKDGVRYQTEELQE